MFGLGFFLVSNDVNRVAITAQGHSNSFWPATMVFQNPPKVFKCSLNCNVTSHGHHIRLLCVSFQRFPAVAQLTQRILNFISSAFKRASACCLNYYPRPSNVLSTVERLTLRGLGILFGFAQFEYPNFLLVFTGLALCQWQFVIIFPWSSIPQMHAHHHRSLIERRRYFGLQIADLAKWLALCTAFFFVKWNTETSWTTPS